MYLIFQLHSWAKKRGTVIKDYFKTVGARAEKPSLIFFASASISKVFRSLCFLSWKKGFLCTQFFPFEMQGSRVFFPSNPSPQQEYDLVIKEESCKRKLTAVALLGGIWRKGLHFAKSAFFLLRRRIRIELIPFLCVCNFS